MAERRLSVAPFHNSGATGTGRASLAGSSRQSLGPARVKSGAGGPPSAELAALNIGLDSAKVVGRASLDPRDSLQRRSSVFGKNLAGNFPGGKDPRPIREKSYQLDVIKNLINFLAKAGYPHPISQKLLTAPSAKDFQNIFKFLYYQLDPGYDFGKKFEEEVPVVMKGLRYPFAGDISKSQLYAVGSMHAWPGLLAMLGWMVDLITCCDVLQAQSEAYFSPDLDPIMSDDSPDRVAEFSAEKVFFEYLCKSYKLFLAGNDSFDHLISELGSNFEKRNESTYREIERLLESVHSQDSEYKSLTTEESPLIKAQREHTVLLSDIEKFKKFISHLDVKRGKFHEAIISTLQEIKSYEAELEELEILRSSLQAQVDAQDICPEDIDRMNSDKDILLKNLESLTTAKEEASKVFWERELLVQKKLDAVEKLIHEYNHLGELLAVIPKEAINAKGRSLELAFNPHATRPDELVNINIGAVIHPALTVLRDECHALIHQAQDQLLSLQEALDKLSENCADKIEELRGNEKKIERIIQSYVEGKQSFANENAKMDEEAEQLRQTIQRLRSDISSQSIVSQQRLQRSTVEYDQLVTTVAAEKERVGTDMYRLLEDLINFKTHVESTVEELEGAFSLEEI